MKPLDWLKNILIGLDETANAILRGSPGETISARAWREQWRIVPLLDTLFWFDPDHCRTSFEARFTRTESST